MVHVEDERFFYDAATLDAASFWRAADTYLIVSERRLMVAAVWPQVRRLWVAYRVFRVAVLHGADLRVLRAFDGRFQRHPVARRRPDYGAGNVNRYPLRAVVFRRMPSLVCADGVCAGPDWKTMQLFSAAMNFDLRVRMVHGDTGFGRLDGCAG